MATPDYWAFISCSYAKMTVLKIPFANFCSLITPEIYPWHGRRVASLNFNCVWFVDPTSSESKSKVFLKLCVKLLTLV